jgi:hypothetical protein
MFMTILLLQLFLVAGILIELREKARCCRGGLRVPHHNFSIGRASVTIELRIRVLIWPQGCAIQRESSKNTSRTWISKNLRMQLGIGIGGRGSANGARSDWGIGPEREFARKKLLGSALIHYKHDHVRFRASDLETEAASLDPNCGWRRPTTPRTPPTTYEASTELAAYDKGALFQAGHNDYTLRLFEQLLRYALVWRGHDFAQDFTWGL